MERISIVIPTYNQGHFIAEAIESALAQIRRPDEIIVIDNDSQDHTRDVVARYPDVRYVHQPNHGVCGSSNMGIAEATGDYIVFLHSDDHMLPTHLSAGIDAFRAHPETAFVCGDYRWFDAADLWHVHRCQPSPDYYGALLRLNFIGPPIVVMFRRDVLTRLGGFRAEFEGADDQDMYFRIARSYPIYCHHQVIAEYRRHAAQNSQKVAVMLDASMRVIRAQRSYIQGDARYQDAYRSGIRHRQHLYGETLFWEGVRAMKTGEWVKALRCVSVLMRHSPQHLTLALHRKLSSAVPEGAAVRPATTQVTSLRDGKANTMNSIDALRIREVSSRGEAL
jgi:glycosyltransferase involved in cell wall biosynthesis